jgi:hypothetical protein
MNYIEDLDYEPMVSPEEFWDAVREEGWQAAEPAERQFAHGGTWDVEPAGPVLGLAVIRTAEGDVSGLSDNELLGAIAAIDRVAGQAAWAANTLAAEYAKRNLEWDPKLGQEVLGEFGADDYAHEIHLSAMTAKGNLNRSVTLDRLPHCMRLAHDGALTDYRQRIIAEETALLDPSLLSKADELIAKGAVGRTPGSLRARCRRIVLLLDPALAEERRKKAAKGRRVEFAPEQSGNAMLAARELSVAVAMGIKQALTGWAKIMRAAGINGTLDNLRADALAALALGRHPVTGGAAPAFTGPAAGGPWDGNNPKDQHPAEQAEDEEAAYFNPWGFQDFEPGQGTEPGPMPGSPVVTINLVITPGTLDPKQDVPGWIPGWGHITGAVARDLITAGTANPASRWCVTEVDPRTGQARAHGCARGQHRWPPQETGPPGTGPPGGGQPGPAARPPESAVSEFVARLNLKMEPIAKTSGDDGHAEPRHDPSRKLQHLIIARNATCATPGCDAPATTSDIEHRIPWENGGPTSEHNLDPGCRHHHRLKQRKDWKVVKTGPRETQWTGPSGRTRVVRATRYL